MYFIFSAPSQTVADVLFSAFSDESDDFCFCADGLRLLDTVIFGNRRTDLILLDYGRYHGFSDFIYNLLDSKNLKIPIILLGDPNCDGEAQIQKWISENEFRYNIQSFHLLLPVLRRIHNALQLPRVRALMADTNHRESEIEELPLRKRRNKANVIERFRKKNDLPPSIYNLLSFMYKNRCREVSIDEIVMHLNIKLKSEKARRNAVYAYIARLRKCINDTPLCTFEVLRTRTGYYRLLLH